MRLRTTLALLALTAVSVAGCVDNQSATTISSPPVVQAPALVSLRDGVAVDVPSEFASGLSIPTFSTQKPGGEPNIGVTPKGNIFLTAGNLVLKSANHGRNWTTVFNLTAFWGAAYNPEPTGNVRGIERSSDDMLWVDTSTGRIFADFMTGLTCSKMFMSDDEGVTWTAQPFDCGVPGNDHQKIATGAWGPTLSPLGLNPAYPDAVYYCYNHAAVAVATGNSMCAVSRDGGLTFESDVPAVPSETDGCGGLNGSPATAPDGTVYLPVTDGCTEPVVGVSTDNGATWTVRHGPNKHGAEELDPDMTVTPDGTAYMLYRGSDHLQYLVRSKDRFATWQGPWKVSPPGVTSTVFAGITSGDNGRIAMAYLGTRDSKKEPSKAANATHWYLYETFSVDAAADVPTLTTLQVTPNEDPVQIGCVWLNGGSNPCRNLLDFIDMTRDNDGRPVVVFTDGCTAAAACAGNATATNKQSRSRTVTVAILDAGPSLLAAKGVLAAPAKP